MAPRVSKNRLMLCDGPDSQLLAQRQLRYRRENHLTREPSYTLLPLSGLLALEDTPRR